MKQNVIILTSGLSGSSVLAALVAQDGYWVGEETIKKKDYDTWENAELVTLNKQILKNVGFEENWTMQFDPAWPEKIAQAAAKLDPTPFRQFLEKCQQHTPWLWKDPRLWLTIRHWQRFLPTENLCYLSIHRDPLQSWVSTTLRRQIQSYRHACAYEEGIHNSIQRFGQEQNRAHLDMLYEDLICDPGRWVRAINQVAETQIEERDFAKIFHGRAYRKQHGLFNVVKAIVIYMKNYRDRIR